MASNDMVQTPAALALVLADHVHLDPASGKYFILGTFDTLCAPAVPWVCPVLQAYAALTDGIGLVTIRLVVTDADEELGPLAQASGQVRMDDPTRRWEACIQLRAVPLPRAGVYRVQLFAGDELLREARLRLAVGPAAGVPGPVLPPG